MEVASVLILIRVSVLVILGVQPLGRLVNSLDRIDGGLQLMGSRILWAPVRFGQGNPKCIVFATVSTQHGSSSGIYCHFAAKIMIFLSKGKGNVIFVELQN